MNELNEISAGKGDEIMKITPTPYDKAICREKRK
jgi:hypothetical protein